MAGTRRKPNPLRALYPERKPEDVYLYDANGNRGPRIDVYRRMLARVIEYEEEVRDGIRTPVYTLAQLEVAEKEWKERQSKRKKRSDHE